MKPKIAFFRIWPSPPIAKSTAEMLAAAFPEYDLEIFDFALLLRKSAPVLLQNFAAAFWHYGWGILTRKRDLRVVFWRTPLIFRWMKAEAGRILAGGGYALSFQLGSLYDASWPGTPHLVYTDHTHLENLNYPGFAADQLSAAAWVALEKTIYANASRVLTRSSNIGRSLQEQYGCPPEKIVQVYMGGNVPVAEDEFPPERERRNILFVGIDWERKGGPDLVAAFEQILPDFPDASLTIVGAAPQVDLPNVEVAGLVPVEALGAYYRRAAIFCLPTYHEPFGAVFVEALAYGLPLVGTCIGAIPDFILPGENGYLVAPGDVTGLAAALRELLADAEKCRRFGERGFQLGRENYNWAAVGARVRQAAAPFMAE